MFVKDKFVFESCLQFSKLYFGVRLSQRPFEVPNPLISFKHFMVTIKDYFSVKHSNFVYSQTSVWRTPIFHHPDLVSAHGSL